MTQQVQGSQSPVQAVQTQMLGEPVLDLVFALEWVSGMLLLVDCAAV
jgi:hypothetical protein